MVGPMMNGAAPVGQATADRNDAHPIFFVLFISRPDSMCFIQGLAMWWKET
jgi:hypothetical protein